MPRCTNNKMIYDQNFFFFLENILINTICDKCKILFSPEHAAQGESSCSRTASDNCRTADPTPGLYRSESHLLEEREAPCCGRVWTFYGTGPEGAGLCMKEKGERKK